MIVLVAVGLTACQVDRSTPYTPHDLADFSGLGISTELLQPGRFIESLPNGISRVTLGARYFVDSKPRSCLVMKDYAWPDSGKVPVAINMGCDVVVTDIKSADNAEK